MSKLSRKSWTLGQICRELEIMDGIGIKARSNVPYLIKSCNVPEHKDNLLNKGLDLDNYNSYAVVPFPAVHYIFEDVFKTKFE